MARSPATSRWSATCAYLHHLRRPARCRNATGWAGNPLLYYVTLIDEQNGAGQLHYGHRGVLLPGKVGAEYFMTKLDFHAWRLVAEVYIGLGQGQGMMLVGA